MMRTIWLLCIVVSATPTLVWAHPVRETRFPKMIAEAPPPAWYRHAQLDRAEPLSVGVLPPVGQVFRRAGGDAELRLAAETIQVVVNPEPHSALIWLTVALGLLSGSYAYALRRQPNAAHGT